MAAGGYKPLLEINLTDQRQLFNSMDPAPFRARDLDPAVVDYIVDWAEDQPRNAELGMVVSLNHETVSDHDVDILREALCQDFRRRAQAERRRLARLFRDGRISMLIGVGFVAVTILITDALGTLVTAQRSATLIEETLVIAAWVALWHPVNIFLYEWWPISAQAKLFDRLAQMDMKLCGATEAILGRGAQ